ncbi:MAG: DUF2852 domain-containing protein [Pseudomonadota bacterium]
MPNISEMPQNPGAQSVSIIFFVGFTISTSIVAIVFFGPPGLLLAMLYAWLWTRSPVLQTHALTDDAVATFELDAPGPDASGNSSCETYRGGVWARLTQNGAQAQSFLARLAAAAAAPEFDQVQTDHAQATRSARMTA